MAFPTLCVISSAALLVNVSKSIEDAGTPEWIRCATRWVITRVLPLPAPAITSAGPFLCATIFFCDLFKVWSGITHRNNACTQSFLFDLCSKFYAKFISQTVNRYDMPAYDFQNS